MAILQILEIQILKLGASTQKISKYAVQGIIDLVLLRQVKLKCIVQNYSQARSYNRILGWDKTLPNVMFAHDQQREDCNFTGLDLTRRGRGSYLRPIRKV